LLLGKKSVGRPRPKTIAPVGISHRSQRTHKTVGFQEIAGSLGDKQSPRYSSSYVGKEKRVQFSEWLESAQSKGGRKGFRTAKLSMGRKKTKTKLKG